MQAHIFANIETTVWKFQDFLSVRYYVKSILNNLEVQKLPFFAVCGPLKFVILENVNFHQVQKLIKI